MFYIEDSNDDKAADMTDSEEVLRLLEKFEADLNERDAEETIVIDANPSQPLLQS